MVLNRNQSSFLEICALHLRVSHHLLSPIYIDVVFTLEVTAPYFLFYFLLQSDWMCLVLRNLLEYSTKITKIAGWP